MSLTVPTAGPPPTDLDHPHLPPRRHGAALAGLVGAILVMVLSLTAFVGGADERRFSGAGIGDPAIDFSLRSAGDASGARVTLSEYRGRPVLLVFADAPLPALSFAQSPSLPRGTLVLCLVPSRDLHLGAQLDSRLGLPALDLLDDGGLVSRSYAVTTSPTAVYVGADGQVLDRGPFADVLGRVAASPTTGRSLAAGGETASFGS